MTTFTDPRLSEVAGLVGRSYADKGGCWGFVREAFALRGVTLPSDYFAAIEKRMFRTVFEPEPWDVVLVCNHALAIANHVALYVAPDLIAHSLEGAGVIVEPFARSRWYERVARARDGRKGYLRLA
jgi:cell wall-associated NlpC family hydrolase